MEDCIFCKIIKGEIPSYKIEEDKGTYTFLDINPMTPGHTLVIAKTHVEHMSDMDPDEVACLFKTVRRMGASIKANLSPDGINYFVNQGEPAGQLIPHVHCHIVPRYEGDGVEFRHSKVEMSEGEFKELVEKIRG